MSFAGLALSRTDSVRQDFAQEAAPNRIPTSRAPDAAYLASNPSSVPSDLPEDTVTISNPPLRTSPNQSTKGGAFSVENSGHYDLLNAKSNSNPSAVSSAQVKADGTPKTSKAAAAQAPSVTAQEQLQQLDRTLQQLGINPESVSLIRRVELLRLADNPAALQQYFQPSFTPSTGLSSLAPSSTAVQSASALLAASASNTSPYVPATNQFPNSTAAGSHLNISA
jgi:hypothetical protein